MKKSEFENNNNLYDESADLDLPENMAEHNKRAEAIQKKLDAQHERSAGVIDGMTGTFHRIESSQTKSSPVEKKPWYKAAFFRKIGFALISAIVALTLWGYVLMKENPTRIKRVANVKLNFEVGAEADLKARGLIVKDDINALLNDVTVNVRTTLNDLPRFNNAMTDVVTASINLSDIREPGTYTRNIVAASTIGTVESVEPKTITITVESMRSTNIPLTCETTGEIPEGYWYDDPRLSQSSISVNGPESIVSQISYGRCVIDLSDITERFYRSLPIELYNSDDELIEMTNAVESIPSVIVAMDVFPYRIFQAEEFISLIGRNDDLFEYKITATPSELSIAASQDVLDDLAEFTLDTIDVNNLVGGDTRNVIVSLRDLPSEAKLINVTNTRMRVVVEILDKEVENELTYKFSSNNLIGKDPNIQYTVTSPEPVYIVLFKGPARFISHLTLSDISFEIDVSKLRSKGEYSVLPKIIIEGDPDWTSQHPSVEVGFGRVNVIVTILEKTVE